MKILAALDLAETTPAVVKEARDWARLGAKLWLLHVVEPNPDSIGIPTDPDTVRDALARQLRIQRARLEELAQDLRQDGIEASTLLVQGPLSATILKEADKLGVNAILMGSHARGQLHELLIGTTRRGVLRHATRPVLLIPPGNA